MENGRSKNITRYYLQRLYKYSAEMKHFDKEAIHRFRVGYKKLRDFLRMAAFAVPDPGQVKLPRRLKEMYTVTGEIRDLQLCLKRIKEQQHSGHGFSKRIHSVKKEIRDLATQNKLFPDQDEFKEIEHSIVGHIPAISGNSLIMTFIRQKLAIINTIIIEGSYRDKDLHDVRKNIKDIIYVSWIFRNDLTVRKRLAASNKPGLVQLRNFSHLLGKFNDAGTALSFLKPAEIAKTRGDERQVLQSLRRRWLGEKREMRKAILAQLPGIKTTDKSTATKPVK